MLFDNYKIIKMANSRKTGIFNLLILFQFSIINANKLQKFCDIEAYCNNCTFCKMNPRHNNSQCSFKNLFCLQKRSNELFFNETILPQYISFFQNNTDNSKIYIEENINLTTLIKSFDLIKITNKDNKNINEFHFYCLINNTKYFNNKRDSAFLSVEYNLQNNIKENNLSKNILFYAIFENTKTNGFLILNGDDEKIKNLKWKQGINRYDKIIILLEFYNKNIFENDEDNFEIEIETKNMSIIKRKNIIRIIGTLIIFFILTIFITRTYSCIKKKKINRELKRVLETERNKKVELFQNIFKNVLTQTELSSRNIIKDYSQCPICLQTFLLKCSICITPCKHVFHYECLKKFAETKIDDISTLKCPLCNFVFLNKKLKGLKCSRNNFQLDRNSYEHDPTRYGVVISKECFNSN